MDERVSRAITELRRAGIDPMEFALMFVDPRDVSVFASGMVVQAKKLAGGGGVAMEWAALQEVFKALATVLARGQPEGATGVIHHDGYFLAQQEKEQTAFRQHVRAALVAFGGSGGQA